MQMRNLKIGLGYPQPKPLRKDIGMYPFITDTAVGVEIELEGFKGMPVDDEYWKVKNDGSLRNGGLEFIFRNPLRGTAIMHALEKLDYDFKKQGHKPVGSYRCSVHVHVDCTDITPRQAGIYGMALMMFEPLLFRFCDRRRTHNPYCVPIGKEYGYVDALHNLVHGRGKLVEKGEVTYMRMKAHINNQIEGLYHAEARYSSINLLSLEKFGTIEVRMLEGTTDIRKLRDWINVLLAIKEWSLTLSEDNLQATFDNISELRAREWVGAVLGPVGARVIRDIPMDDELLLEGVRNAQDVLYFRRDVQAKVKAGKPFIEQLGLKKNEEEARVRGFAELEDVAIAKAEKFEWAIPEEPPQQVGVRRKFRIGG